MGEKDQYVLARGREGGVIDNRGDGNTEGSISSLNRSAA